MKHTISMILSEGYILGKIRLKKKEKIDEVITSPTDEKEKITKAIDKSLNEILSMDKTNPQLNDYINIQTLMLSDPNLKNGCFKYIDKGLSSFDAINQVIEDYLVNLKTSNSTYLRERVNDFEDILERIIKNLNNDLNLNDKSKYILVTNTLYPSYLINHKSQLLGVIAKTGGYTSHSAILCRSLDIPFVLCNAEFNDGDCVIIDTRKELIIDQPTKEDLENYKQIYKDRNRFNKQAIPHSDYLFLANASSNNDLVKALAYGFDAIGLYRTEMIFMNLDRPYTKEEQFSIYEDAVNIMKDKPITFRTFDIGEDKQIKYLKTFKKGIDNYKNNPTLFEDQVYALLKANKYNNMKIMFPMIETKEEFIFLKDWVIRICKNNNFNIPKIGMMLETKKALNSIEDFTMTDFISIGTNDLTKELYQIDRDNDDNKYEYMQDLLERLKPVVKFCNDNNICLSVCGELAAVKATAVSLYNIGIKNLSVAPSLIRMLNIVYSLHKNEV